MEKWEVEHAGETRRAFAVVGRLTVEPGVDGDSESFAPPSADGAIFAPWPRLARGASWTGILSACSDQRGSRVCKGGYERARSSEIR